ncbi:unnamed protein product [Orchesella dallaii]|uniref:Uncharacterized protein n=1 Tax=Orchesella dallaii TaxID=48710 RepID=A0ABP1QHQ0_9HEXA
MLAPDSRRLGPFCCSVLGNENKNMGIPSSCTELCCNGQKSFPSDRAVAKDIADEYLIKRTVCRTDYVWHYGRSRLQSMEPNSTVFDLLPSSNAIQIQVN